MQNYLSAIRSGKVSYRIVDPRVKWKCRPQAGAGKAIFFYSHGWQPQLTVDRQRSREWLSLSWDLLGIWCGWDFPASHLGNTPWPGQPKVETATSFSVSKCYKEYTQPRPCPHQCSGPSQWWGTNSFAALGDIEMGRLDQQGHWRWELVTEIPCPREAAGGGGMWDRGPRVSWGPKPSAHALLSHQTSRTKHRFKVKTVKDLRIAGAEH